MTAKNGRILIVDDCDLNVKILQKLLQNEYELATAYGGEECLQEFRQFNPDLVLLDVMIPDIDGYEVCRRIKSSPCGDFTHVILVTAKGSPPERLEGYEVGADDYVVKPFDHEELLAKVRIQFRLRGTLEKLWLANDKIRTLNAETANANEQLQREIVERKRAEKALRQRREELQATNRELKQKNAELDEFTYVASHDLQEPLRKLISFSQLLREDLGDDLSEDVEEDVSRIVDGAKRMQRLIQDLLQLSRVGRAAVRRVRCPLDECVDQAMDGLALRIEESGARIIRDDLPEVIGDKTLLTQLYHNLISNALKFAGQQPPVIHLTAQQDGNSWTLGVKDNGIGMEPKYAEDVFKPFKRLHGQSKYSGTGIGLAICRKAVERHGGKIWVESQCDQGAHFRFTFGPAAETEKPRCQAQPQTA